MQCGTREKPSFDWYITCLRSETFSYLYKAVNHVDFPFYLDFLKAPMVPGRALFLGCSEIYGLPFLGELPSPLKGCSMFLRVHTPAWEPFGIRSYTLCQGRKQR